MAESSLVCPNNAWERAALLPRKASTMEAGKKRPLLLQGGAGRATPSPRWRQRRVPGLALARVAGVGHPLFLGLKRPEAPQIPHRADLHGQPAPNTPAIALAGPCQSH
jgi:hypothetical protein